MQFQDTTFPEQSNKQKQRRLELEMKQRQEYRFSINEYCTLHKPYH